MRIDKYLKDTRLVKRRSVAKQMCDAGKILINGLPVKASKIVAVGDEITVEYVKMFLKVEVVTLQIPLSKSLASTAYKELSKEIKE